jgi:CspA family cold shock protein
MTPERVTTATARRCGVVASFNPLKGWGFITPDDGGADVFVHFSGIVMPLHPPANPALGRRNLNEGQRVRFLTVTGFSGRPEAVKVVVVQG